MQLSALRAAFLSLVGTCLAAGAFASELSTPRASSAGAHFTRSEEVVFIDGEIAGHEALVLAVQPGRSTAVLASGPEPWAEIATRLAGAHGLRAVHLVSHGEPGRIGLGAAPLDIAGIPAQRAALAAIGRSLAPDGVLLLYGCAVARGEEGRRFLAALTEAVGHPVAASENATGSASAGGGADWVLESATGPIGAKLPFEDHKLAAFTGRLATPGATVIVSAQVYAENLPDAAVLRDANGDFGFVVSWYDGNSANATTTGEVRTQLFNLTADAQGSSSIFNVQTNSGQGSSGLADIALTALSGGRFAGAWRDANTTSGAYEVSSNVGTVNRTTFALSRLSDDRRVNVADAPSNMAVALTQLTGGVNDGAVLYAYALNTSTGQESYLRYRAINDAGTAVIPETSLNSSGVLLAPGAAALPDGRFALAYSFDSDGSLGTASDRTIVVRLFNAAGVAEGSAVTASATTAANRTSGGATLLSDGSLLVAWRTATGADQEIYFRIYDVSGATPVALTSEMTANDYIAGTQGAQQIAALPQGGFVAAFNSANQAGASSATDVYYRVFDNRGNAAVDAALVNTVTAGVQANPALATASDGRIFIAWQDATNSGDIHATYFTAVHPIVDLDQDVPGTGYAATLDAQLGGVAIADSDATLTDANGDHLQSVVVTITNRLDGNAESLVLASATGLTVTGSGTGTLTLTNAGSATRAQFEAALEALRYVNYSAVDKTTRALTVTAADTTHLAHTATTSLRVVAATPSPFTAPAVTAATSANVTHAAATLGGNVTADGGATITERGVVYSVAALNPGPAIGGTGVTKAAGSGTTGVFTVGVSGLAASTSYAFKAYATNSAGTTYSSAATFATSAPPDTTAPALTSAGTATATYRTAGFTFTVTADEAATFTATGLPAGLSITSGGVISGTPTTTGTFTVDLVATDAASNSGLGTLTLTVDRRPTGVSGLSIGTKTYDATRTATLLTAGATFTAVVAGDDVSLDASGASALFECHLVGSGLNVSVSGLALAGTDAAHYTFTPPSWLTGAITPRLLTIQADTLFKTFRAANPELTYTATGFASGESAATALTGAPALTTTATETSAPGAYAIEIAADTLHARDGSYTFSFEPATLTVLAYTYETWKAQVFTSGDQAALDRSGPEADPDSDGIRNVLEYAFDLDPNTAAVSGLPVRGTITILGSSYLTLSFTRSKVASDLNYEVQSSGDLLAWENLTPVQVGAAIDHGDTETVTYRDATATTAASRRFLRVRTTLMPTP